MQISQIVIFSKSILRGKFIALNTHVRKKERSNQMQVLARKEEQIKLKTRRLKGIIQKSVKSGRENNRENQ